MNIEVPLILSIASLRKFNKHIPIYVLDYSSHPKEWNVVEQLNFTVVPVNSKILRYHEIYGLWPPQRRPIDILRFSKVIPHKYVIFSDADIIWLDNILPLRYDDKFHIGRLAAGFFYFSKENKFIEYWAEKCSQIIKFDEKGNFLIQGTGDVINDKYQRLDEEVIYRYLRDIKDFDENLLSDITYHESTLIGEFIARFPAVKSIHFHGSTPKDRWKYNVSRGNTILMIKEFYEIVNSVLEVSNFKNLDLSRINSMSLEEFRQWMQLQ